LAPDVGDSSAAVSETANPRGMQIASNFRYIDPSLLQN